MKVEIQENSQQEQKESQEQTTTKQTSTSGSESKLTREEVSQRLASLEQKLTMVTNAIEQLVQLQAANAVTQQAGKTTGQGQNFLDNPIIMKAISDVMGGEEKKAEPTMLEKLAYEALRESIDFTKEVKSAFIGAAARKAMKNIGEGDMLGEQTGYHK